MKQLFAWSFLATSILYTNSMNFSVFFFRLPMHMYIFQFHIVDKIDFSFHTFISSLAFRHYLCFPTRLLHPNLPHSQSLPLSIWDTIQNAFLAPFVCVQTHFRRINSRQFFFLSHSIIHGDFHSFTVSDMAFQFYLPWKYSHFFPLCSICRLRDDFFFLDSVHH